jgi:beta-glucanase (GH16 family)
MPTPAQQPQAHNAQVILFDDFTANELDRSAWNVEVTGQTVNNEQQAYIDSPETIYLQPGDHDSAHGMLVIQPRYRAGYVTPQGARFDFVSGRINTRGKIEFVYGSIAARIALPVGIGFWPAFWVMGAAGEWPACGEVDIMENAGEPDWTSVALHGPGYSGETPLVNKKYFSTDNDATAWHTYSLDWTPAGSLFFKIDGELIYRVTRPMVEFYGRWVYDNRKFLILNCALGGTYPFKTSGVRAPYYGLPQGTIQSIRNNDTRMLVDWVKVTRAQ